MGTMNQIMQSDSAWGGKKTKVKGISKTVAIKVDVHSKALKGINNSTYMYT